MNNGGILSHLIFFHCPSIQNKDNKILKKKKKKKQAKKKNTQLFSSQALCKK
jgi:hypothetical protein